MGTEDEHQVNPRAALRAPVPRPPQPHCRPSDMRLSHSSPSIQPAESELLEAFTRFLPQQPTSCLSDGEMLLSQVAEVKISLKGRKGGRGGRNGTDRGKFGPSAGGCWCSRHARRRQVQKIGERKWNLMNGGRQRRSDEKIGFLRRSGGAGRRKRMRLSADLLTSSSHQASLTLVTSDINLGRTLVHTHMYSDVFDAC